MTYCEERESLWRAENQGPVKMVVYVQMQSHCSFMLSQNIMFPRFNHDLKGRFAMIH